MPASPSPERIALCEGLAHQYASDDSSSEDELARLADIVLPAVAPASPPAPAHGLPAPSTPAPGGWAAQEEPQRIRRRAYSIQFSDSKDPAHRRPCTFTRESFAELLQDRHNDFFRKRRHNGNPVNAVVKVMVFKELHSGGDTNYFAGILCDKPYRPCDIQKALRDTDRVYVSFGSSHAYFWTIVVYGGTPSIHKAIGELDKDPYHSQGKTLREELADIPKGARVADKQRVSDYLGMGQRGRSGKTQVKGMGIDEFAELVRTNEWRTKRAVFEAAGSTRETSPALYETVLRWGGKRIDEVLGTVWEMEGDDLEPTGCRVQALLSAARSMPCTCGGQWQRAADRLMDIQGLDSVAVRSAIVRALRWGRHKGVNVLIVGEPDGGKSFILKPLGNIFKTFIRRGQNETFSLQGIHGSEICLLQDVRYETFGLPWDDWLAWGEGEKLTIRLPRNHFTESKDAYTVYVHTHTHAAVHDT